MPLKDYPILLGDTAPYTVVAIPYMVPSSLSGQPFIHTIQNIFLLLFYSIDAIWSLFDLPFDSQDFHVLLSITFSSGRSHFQFTFLSGDKLI